MKESSSTPRRKWLNGSLIFLRVYTQSKVQVIDWYAFCPPRAMWLGHWYSAKIEGQNSGVIPRRQWKKHRRRGSIERSDHRHRLKHSAVVQQTERNFQIQFPRVDTLLPSSEPPVYVSRSSGIHRIRISVIPTRNQKVEIPIFSREIVDVPAQTLRVNKIAMKSCSKKICRSELTLNCRSHHLRIKLTHTI